MITGPSGDMWIQSSPRKVRISTQPPHGTPTPYPETKGCVGHLGTLWPLYMLLFLGAFYKKKKKSTRMSFCLSIIYIMTRHDWKDFASSQEDTVHVLSCTALVWCWNSASNEALLLVATLAFVQLSHPSSRPSQPTPSNHTTITAISI